MKNQRIIALLEHIHGVFFYRTTGKEIYLASTFAPEYPQGVWGEHYLMIINADGTYDPENFMVEFDDLKKSNQPLAEVKEKKDWQGKTGPMG